MKVTLVNLSRMSEMCQHFMTSASDHCIGKRTFYDVGITCLRLQICSHDTYLMRERYRSIFRTSVMDAMSRANHAEQMMSTLTLELRLIVEADTLPWLASWDSVGELRGNQPSAYCRIYSPPSLSTRFFVQ